MSLGQGLASKYYSGFNPLIYGNCALWVDAGDTTTLTLSGSNITAVRDKSPQSNAITVSATQPTYVSNRQNGLGGIFMNGASWLINTTMSYSLANRTVFIVAEQTASSTTSFEGIIVFGGNATTLDFNSSNAIVYSARGSNAGQNVSFSVYGRGGDYVLNFGTSTTPMPFRVYSESFAYPNGTLFVDGSQTVTDTAALTVGTATGWVIGGRFDNNNSTPRVPLYGYIYEILVYSNTLPAIDRQAIESYLAWKWGRTANLPTTHPYASIVPVTRSFLPLDISGCALWLDAADPSTLTLSGSNVTAWADKSGNTRNTSGVSGTPVLSNNSVISRQGVYFNGSSYFTGPFSYSSNTLSWFIVGTMESDGEAFGRLLSLGAAGQFDFDSALRMNALSREGTTTELVSFRNSSFIARNMNISYGTPFVTSSVINGTSNFPFLNGTLATGGATSTNFGFTTYGISGSFGANIQRNKGFIFEVLIYTGALTSNERQQVEGYLARKWGRAGSLPGTHPFISRLPATVSFNPRQIPNCALWLDAADRYTLTLSGSNVTTWSDKSGNGRNASGGVSPTYSSNGVQFSGSSFLTTTAPAGSNNASYFIVFNPTSPSTANALIGGNVLSTAVIYLNASTLTFGDWNTAVATNPTTILAGITYISSGIASSGTLSLGINGGSLTSGSATFSGSGTLTIGAGFTDNRLKYSGAIYEIIAYSSTLTTSQRQQVEGYLSWKWGLQGPPPTLQYTAFTPTDITGCSMWLDAADTTKVSLSGSNITGLTDKSPNGYVLSNASNFTYNQVKFNGVYPSFHTTGAFSSGHLGINSAFRLSQPFTVFVVGQVTADSGKFPYIMDSAPPSPSSRVVLYYWNNAGYRMRLFAGGEIEFNTGASAPFINTYRVNTTSSELLLNGTSVVTGSIGSGSMVGIIVGNANANDGIQIWGGHICEILMYNSLLSTTQRQQVEGYLAIKWGLQGNLPSTHPYANRGLPSTHPYKKISPI